MLCKCRKQELKRKHASSMHHLQSHNVDHVNISSIFSLWLDFCRNRFAVKPIHLDVYFLYILVFYVYAVALFYYVDIDSCRSS